MGGGRALRQHLGGAAAFLALLSVVAVVPLVAEADPAGAHRKTVRRCSFDPFAGQQCWHESVSHTHPKPTTPPTTAPPATTPPPLTTCGNGGASGQQASGQGDASGDCTIVEPPPTTAPPTTAPPPTTQPPLTTCGNGGASGQQASGQGDASGDCTIVEPPPTTAPPTTAPPATTPPPLTTCGNGGASGQQASGQGDASGDCTIVEPPPECLSGHHNHDNRGCHPQSDPHCLSGYHTHDGRGCHRERDSHCPQGRQAQGQIALHICPDTDSDEDGTDNPPPVDPPCDLTLGSRANMAHRHPQGSGGHTDCQHHTRPGCRPGVPTPWSPGAGHYDRTIDPCPLAAVTQVGLDPEELGKPGSITNGWNPLTTEVCGRYANQGMRPDTARRKCFSDYGIAAVEWSDDYDLHTALREAKAAGAAIDKNLWDLATQIGRAIEGSAKIYVRTHPGSPAGPVVRLLPEPIQQPVCEGIVSAGADVASLRARWWVSILIEGADEALTEHACQWALSE